MEAKPDYRDVHRVAEVFHELNHVPVDKDKLSEEVVRILGGTAPEDEFMAIATWSGRCSLIHKLAPDKYPPPADGTYKVPDLVAVFDYEDRRIPVLIEVKSTFTSQVPGPVELADFSPSYRQKLKNYGKMLGLPVLVAQQIKPSGLWVLVDLETIGADGKPFVDFKHDLSGILLGTFHLAFRDGTKFVMQLEKMAEIDPTKVTGVVRKASFVAADGTEIRETHSPMVLLFGLGDPVETQDDDGRMITITWEISENMAFINYQALRAAISFDKKLADDPFPWATILKSGKFPILASRIEDAIKDHEFFGYSISTRPQEIPAFLKGEGRENKSASLG